MATASSTSIKRRGKLAIADTKAAFLEQLAIDGNVSRSAKAVGVDRVELSQWRKADAEFAKEWELCREMGIDGLRDECIRRAMEGELVPMMVAGKKEFVRKYSDALLIFLLKDAFPEKYRDRQPRVTVSTNYGIQDDAAMFEKIREKIKEREAAKHGTGLEQGDGSA